jgi:hypothetical protein
MTLAEAILDIESWFNVHAEVGFADGYSDQQGRPFGTAETRDMETAPCGEPYAVVVSGGVYTVGAMPMLFHSEGAAIQFWRYAIEDYADEVAPGGGWKDSKSLHLYWRDQPVFERQTYVALDQAGMLRNRSKLASQLTIDVGIVWSRLLISRLDPDGKE